MGLVTDWWGGSLVWSAEWWWFDCVGQWWWDLGLILGLIWVWSRHDLLYIFHFCLNVVVVFCLKECYESLHKRIIQRMLEKLSSFEFLESSCKFMLQTYVWKPIFLAIVSGSWKQFKDEIIALFTKPWTCVIYKSSIQHGTDGQNYHILLKFMFSFCQLLCLYLWNKISVRT